jgi:hypothetical protein
MLPIDSVKLMMMLMNAALSVTEPIAGFQITGEWVWSHFVQIVKISAKPPQDSASALGLRNHTPSHPSRRVQGTMELLESLHLPKVASKSSSDIMKHALSKKVSE